MGRYYTDQERYEFCRKYRLSKKTISEFANENGINRHTFGDWLNAYGNIDGKFINIKDTCENENEIVKTKDYRVNVLDEMAKVKKSNHFSRFDHSIVVIEIRDIKITTSLEQAEVLLGRILGNDWF